MLDEALFNAVNVLARPPELVLEVVESSVSAMVLVFWIFMATAAGGQKKDLVRICAPHRDSSLISCFPAKRVAV